MIYRKKAAYIFGALSKKEWFLFLGGGVLLGVGVVLFWLGSLTAPDLNSFHERRISQSAKIYDRTGEVLLFNLGENVKRTTVPFDSISRNVKNATVAIEDSEFYEHKGVRPLAFLRAILINLTSLEFAQGGSTITQQVVKNSILTTEKKISRKLKEWALAIKLEQTLTKDQILEIYLNESPYGGSLYGVEEASQAFFGKSSTDVTLAEAAYLAALPQAPTFYSPYGNNQEALKGRKNLVLLKMKEKDFISEEEYQSAIKEEVEFLPPPQSSLRAPHFVFYVRDYLEKKYGREMVETSGLKIITTLNYALQQKAEEIVKSHALQNEKNFNAENASLVAIDPKTGEILVMVGSRDYFDKEIDGNFNAALGKRQPGSSFKPFVYATAFQKGFTPETVVFDLKTQFSSLCAPNDFSDVSPCYTPQNYDNVFRGPVSFRNALAQSINIPAVKALYLAGLPESLKTARDMGITTLTEPDRYGLTLVLGGGEVTLLDMTSAYGAFANDGIRNPHTAILRIEDSSGNVLEEHSPRSIRVLPEETSRMISDVLSDNEARSPAFGERSLLYFPGREVAAKTGTTNDYRDAWIVGYTPNIAVGAWAGNNDNSSMEKRVAGFIVAPLWNAFMQEVLPVLPEEQFKKPQPTSRSLRAILRGVWQGGETYLVDRISGKLATSLTPEETLEERAVKNVHSILYWVDKKDPTGAPPKNPEGDAQFLRWEYPVRLWAIQNGFVEENNSVIPKETDQIHTENNKPKISVNTSASASSIIASITVSSVYPMSRVDVYVNGVLFSSLERAPFVATIPRSLIMESDLLVIKVVGYDSVYNKGEAVLNVSVN